jgi:hypothetical protein
MNDCKRDGKVVSPTTRSSEVNKCLSESVFFHQVSSHQVESSDVNRFLIGNEPRARARFQHVMHRLLTSRPSSAAHAASDSLRLVRSIMASLSQLYCNLLPPRHLDDFKFQLFLIASFARLSIASCRMVYFPGFPEHEAVPYWCPCSHPLHLTTNKALHSRPYVSLSPHCHRQRHPVIQFPSHLQQCSESIRKAHKEGYCPSTRRRAPEMRISQRNSRRPSQASTGT